MSGMTLVLDSAHEGNIWLGGVDYFDNNNAVWGNEQINNIDASNNNRGRIIAGNSSSNEIKAGSGSSSLWGGIGGDDTLTGGNSRDFFWYVDGNGNDRVKNFTAGSNSSGDVLVLQGNLAAINRSGNTITVTGQSGGTLTVETDFTYDETILYSIDGQNIGAAKIADTENTLYYDNNVNYFQFNDNDGTVNFALNGVNIALDGSNGQEFVGAKNIRCLVSWSDNTLTGNDLDNEIRGGAGNDTLTGGGGADTFFWGNGGGKDLITDAENDDTINLYNVSLSDILEYFGLQVSSQMILITLNDGSQLEVRGKDNVTPTSTFQLSDGSRWKYQGGGWQQQS